MNTIGFKNFRKFPELPAIELGGITLLVGGNNSGKSTLVKAMLLMHNFLSQRINRQGGLLKRFDPTFRFDHKYIHIGTFKRAFCNKSAEDLDSMSFTAGIGQFVFDVEIKGERQKESPLTIVSKLSIVDTKRAVKFNFDYSNHTMSALFSQNKESRDRAQEVGDLKERLKELKEELSASKELERNVVIKDEMNSIVLKLDVIDNTENNEELLVSFNRVTFEDSDYNSDSLLMPELVEFFSKYSRVGTVGNKKGKDYEKEKSDKNALRGKSSVIDDIANDLNNVLLGEKIEYIYAHSASQQVLFNIKDTNDFLTKTIHEFYMERISEGDMEYEFIKKWMMEFEIGMTFKISDPIAGEAYQIEIIDEDGDSVQLADKGMGSIQLMILLLRISTLIRRHNGTPVTILIEEPEQNLHPALQSKLADLLLEINQLYKLQLIVETHSEYLVRRSQVIVATKFGSKDELSKNPFRTYYMPPKGIPYSMGYNEKGRFEENFGEGFFDEAGKSNVILMKKERGML